MVQKLRIDDNLLMTVIKVKMGPGQLVQIICSFVRTAEQQQLRAISTCPKANIYYLLKGQLHKIYYLELCPKEIILLGFS